MADRRRWDVVLFDLDGTLIDPFEGIADGVRKAFAAVDQPAPEDATIRGWIGPPIGDTLEAQLGHLGAGAVATALAAFRAAYDNGGAQSAALHAGMRDLIIALDDDGAFLAVVTMKPRHVTDVILDQLGLRSHLDGVFAPPTDHATGNKADLIAEALAVAGARGLSADGGVVVGDRADDMRAARENGLAAVGVAWGFGSAAEMLRERPLQVATSPPQLAALLLEGKV